ncbi:hypothetical protein LCGC14_2861970, partial [marine sediment metagenome]
GKRNTYIYHKCRCDLCTASMATYQGKLRRKRQAWLSEIKLAEGCADCGYNEYACALHFDHLPEFDKIASVSTMLAGNRPISVIEDEMAKCEVVCANCHAVRTFITRNTVS